MSADTTEQTLRETFIEVAALTIHMTVKVPRVDVDDRELPPYREECEYAAQLFGMVIALNGPMVAIVKAASDDAYRCVMCGARYRCVRGRTDYELLPGHSACADCSGGGSFERITSAGYIRKTDTDPAALFRAIAIESLGGAKVSDAFGVLQLPQIGGCTDQDCVIAAHRSKRLTVPRLTIEGAQT